MRWDLFCRVIDNHGDLGVCWRLAAELAARGDAVRLWVDEPQALAWMAPAGSPGVELVHWHADSPGPEPGDAVVEAFGCDPHEAFVHALADKTRREGRQPAWINLEYLSAQAYVERCHGLTSPVMSGPARGLVKQFIYPGLTAGTGGLLREADYDARRSAFDAPAWRSGHQLPAGGNGRGERLVSLFCYEPTLLGSLLADLAASPQPTRLLVTQGRARAAVEAAVAASGSAPLPAITWLPLMPQTAYDELLWACDFNLVRGEDSLVRALWAGRPLAWHIYPQDDGAHQAKLLAFLDWLQAPASLRDFHAGWNSLAPALPPLDLPAWADTARAAQNRLRAGPDLVDSLRAAAQAHRQAQVQAQSTAAGGPAAGTASQPL